MGESGHGEEEDKRTRKVWAIIIKAAWNITSPIKS